MTIRGNNPRVLIVDGCMTHEEYEGLQASFRKSLYGKQVREVARVRVNQNVGRSLAPVLYARGNLRAEPVPTKELRNKDKGPRDKWGKLK